MYNEEIKMKKAIENMQNKLQTIRVGRASASILNGIMVNYYNTPTPIQSVANITIPEAKKIFIKPFDRNTLKDIERGINEANLGITPTNNGEIIILTIPDLNEEKRKEYVKQAKAIGEEGKVALRNVRQDVKEAILKDKYPEDEEKMLLEDLQDLVNKYNKIVDEEISLKEKELMSI